MSEETQVVNEGVTPEQLQEQLTQMQEQISSMEAFVIENVLKPTHTVLEKYSPSSDDECAGFECI